MGEVRIRVARQGGVISSNMIKIFSRRDGKKQADVYGLAEIVVA